MALSLCLPLSLEGRTNPYVGRLVSSLESIFFSPRDRRCSESVSTHTHDGATGGKDPAWSGSFEKGSDFECSRSCQDIRRPAYDASLPLTRSIDIGRRWRKTSKVDFCGRTCLNRLDSFHWMQEGILLASRESERCQYTYSDICSPSPRLAMSGEMVDDRCHILPNET